MAKLIDETELVIFDTETTGLDVFSGDRVVEIAAVKIKGDRCLSSFESMLNPGKAISPDAFKVNGISQKELDAAPLPGEVLPRFIDFVGGNYLCSYNAAFDLGFLNNELVILGRKRIEGILVVDMLKLSRSILPGLKRYPLWFVASELGIKRPQEHRALADVMMTIEVFLKLKEKVRKDRPFEFEDLLSLSLLGDKDKEEA